MSTADTAELVSGENQQPLYWLAFAARHSTAPSFWERIRSLDVQQQSSVVGVAD